jgi:hypothetical protein
MFAIYCGGQYDLFFNAFVEHGAVRVAHLHGGLIGPARHSIEPALLSEF